LKKNKNNFIFTLTPHTYFKFTLLSFLLIIPGCNKLDSVDTLPAKVTTEQVSVPSVEAITPTEQANTPTEQANTPTEQANTPTVQANATKESIKDNLCGENEEVLLSFQLTDSDKTATICISKNEQEYIIFRYGTRDEIELEYPETSDNSWGKFTYSYYLRGGGIENEGMDANYLNFNIGGYSYRIYDEYYSRDDETCIGIILINQDSGEETELIGDSDSIEGSLISLRDNDKIGKEN
jgi:hypothetical protein